MQWWDQKEWKWMRNKYTDVIYFSSKSSYNYNNCVKSNICSEWRETADGSMQNKTLIERNMKSKTENEKLLKQDSIKNTYELEIMHIYYFYIFQLANKQKNIKKQKRGNGFKIKKRAEKKKRIAVVTKECRLRNFCMIQTIILYL